MFSPLRLFAEPEHAVLSLEVQARMGAGALRERGQFELLVRHLVDRMLNNHMAAAEGEAKARLLQAMYAVALPGVVVAMFLFVPYHAPGGGRPYWSQVSDQYFYVVYSFAAVGAFTLFEWDLFFPDLLDVFVIATLPVTRQRLFLARVAAIALFLGVLILGLNILGALFLPAASDIGSLARHVLAHLVAVVAAGVFSAAGVLAVQGALLAVLGQRAFQRISPYVQGLALALLLTALFLFPVVGQFLRALLTSGNSVVERYFPPFWFLGVYEVLLRGGAAEAVFFTLAGNAVVATVMVVALAMLLYPLAYWRKTRELIEGRPVRRSQPWAAKLVGRVLHGTLLRRPADRGVYHFISQTLFRTPRHRVYLAMYGGVGFALAASSVLQLRIGHGHVGLALSADGLRAAIPLVAFWSIAGLRGAFVAPVDHGAGWVFRAIHGRPSLQVLEAARTWALVAATGLTLATVALVHLVAPAELRGADAAAAQVIVGCGLCLLLRDALFFKVRVVPFTARKASSRMNLAIILIQYFGLFPPLVLVSISLLEWVQRGMEQIAVAVVVIAGAHWAMQRRHEKSVTEYAELLDIDGEEDEFPQRLGLRY